MKKQIDESETCQEQVYQLSQTGYSYQNAAWKYNHDEAYWYADHKYSMDGMRDAEYFHFYFLEAQLDGPFPEGTRNSVHKNRFLLTSEAGITPEAVPFKDCGIDFGCQQYLT